MDPALADEIHNGPNLNTVFDFSSLSLSHIPPCLSLIDLGIILKVIWPHDLQTQLNVTFSVLSIVRSQSEIGFSINKKS